MDFWLALIGSRPVCTCLVSAVLTLVSLALALPICIITTIEFLGANLVSFCELARPEPVTSQDAFLDVPHTVILEGCPRIEPDDSESLQSLRKSLYDDHVSARINDSDPTAVGSISPKTVEFFLKPTYLFLDKIDFSPAFSESEVSELLSDGGQHLLSNNSNGEEEVDERQRGRPTASGLHSDVPTTFPRPSQTFNEGYHKVKSRKAINSGRSTAAEAQARDDFEDTDESSDDDDDNDNDDKEEEDEFAEVKEAVDLDAIKKQAILSRAKQILTNSNDPADPIDDLSCEIESESMSGSYNLVYVIRWSDDVKWVVRIPRNGCRFTMLDVAKMQSTYGTMELVRKNASVPIPEVFFYTWMPDRAGVPFALMSHVEGKMLFNFWHDPATTPDWKLATLTSIAKHMVDLSKLKFPDTGMLYFDSGEGQPRVGPVIETFWVGSPEMLPRCNSIKTTLSKWLEERKYRTKRAGSHMPIFRAAIDSIPDIMEGKDQYSICFPDFDWQNIMVSDNGDITGFIDWDDVEIKPMSNGAGKYPCWVTRDWQPASYGWELEKDMVDEDGTTWREESPEQLSMYRQHYLEVFTALQGPEYDGRCTKMSHILDTLRTGVYDEVASGPNINKLFRYGGVPFKLADYADSFVEDDTAEKDQIIQQAFKKMWHAEWEEAEMGEEDTGRQCKPSANPPKDGEV